RDVRDVVSSMPGVDGQGIIERQKPDVRMPESSLEIVASHSSRNKHQAPMKRFDQRERDLRGGGARFFYLRPPRFIIRPDRRLALGQRELEANVGIQMAVRYVMDYLTHGPSIRPVGSLELLIAHPGDRVSQVCRSFGDLIDQLDTPLIAHVRFKRKL